MVLDTAPTGPEFTLCPEQFLAILRRRLRWPLPLAEATCEGCGAHLDEYGDHRGACMRSGRVQRRAVGLERAVARICWEAGARVRMHARLVDMNVAVRAADARRIEVLAAGLPCFGGAQLAIDATLRSVCHRDGSPRARADWQDGAVLADACAGKRATYHELTAGGRCRLIVFAVEVGGRFGADALDLMEQLAWARARASPAYLRRAAAFGFSRRWARLAAVAAASSWAVSVLGAHAAADQTCLPRAEPWLLDLLSETRLEDPPPRQEDGALARA